VGSYHPKASPKNHVLIIQDHFEKCNAFAQNALKKSRDAHGGTSSKKQGPCPAESLLFDLCA
jgi:hypothetical protein